MSASLADFFALLNDVLQGAIVIFGAGVTLFNLPYWRRDRVTRAFSNLVFFVIIVYFSELLATRAQLSESTEFLLQAGWLGIAFVPASQFHLSEALLVTTGYFSNRRRLLVRFFYIVGLLFLIIVLATDWLAANLVSIPHAPHLQAGSLFPLFALYFWGVIGVSIYNVYLARSRCVTRTTRRRMTVVLLAFLAAPLGVFPYQLISNNDAISLGFWLILIAGNLIVGIMFALLTNHLAYFGRVSPDRVVRVRLYKFMARVPMTATLVLIAYILAGRVSPSLGLPAKTAQAVAVVATTMLVEWVIHQFKRPLERLFQLNDEPDVRRIQELSERIFTTGDLHQFLESILTATCDTLRTPAAFIAAITPDGPQLEVMVGQLTAPEEIWQADSWKNNGTGDELSMPAKLRKADNFVLWENYWIRPLYNETKEKMLGILGLEGRAEMPDLSRQEAAAFDRFASQAEAALEDRFLQQDVFAAVEGLLPAITARQRQRSAAAFGSPSQIAQSLTSDPDSSESMAVDPEFNQMVRDALSHYWGGPKLTSSPLIRLKVVQEALTEHEGNPTKALRSILQRAIERQRPEGERRMTTTEWILYNILELKFVQGQKVRDIARRLAMSESDLYRKQRVAIENVARALSQMEQEALVEGSGD